MSKFSLLSTAAGGLAIAAMPSLAHAGTETASGTATFNVVNQCSVTGASVNLGTYTSSQLLIDIAEELGAIDNTDTYNVGSRGQSYVTWGSVTCDNGTPYTLNIQGTSGNPGMIKFDDPAGNFRADFDIFVKSIGGTTIADTDAAVSGAGAKASASPVAGTGTGAAQEILGSAVYNSGLSSGSYTTPLTVGTMTDTLTYTLNF